MDPELKKHLPLTPVVFHTLLALTEGASHGYAIAQEVERLTEERVRMGPGTLYGTLQRLTELEFIAEMSPTDVSDGGHSSRRRYYGLTPLGRRALEAETVRLSDMVRFAERRLALPEQKSAP